MATPVQKFSVTVRSLNVSTSHRMLSVLVVDCPKTKDVYVEMDRNVGVNPKAVTRLVEKIEGSPEKICSIIAKMAGDLFATQSLKVCMTEAQGYVETLHPDEVAAELKGAFQFNGTVTLL